MGTPAVTAVGVQFTLHQIPLTTLHLGYCPKISPQRIDWEKLREAGLKNRCVAIRFDVPNVIKGEEPDFEEELKKKCQRAPKDTFARQTIILDLTPDEEIILKKMHPKTRYNLKLAERKWVTVAKENTPEALEVFLNLQRETANRQGFYIHPDSYYKNLWETFAPAGQAHLLIAKLRKTPLAAWMLLNSEGVLYYPYGGSSHLHRDLMASNLVMWEAIRLGKNLGCRLFDMWGATNNEKDAWYGFTRFKLGYGGNLIEFLPSYDFVLNPLLYNLFNLGYHGVWKLLNVRARLKKLKR